VTGGSRSLAVLITSDAYRIGGRETFIDVHLGEARRRGGARAALIASHVTGPGANEVFDRICEVPGTGLASLPGWIAAGEEQRRETNLDLVWAQHFMLLHAWVLGARLGRPVLPTFHGPLTSTGLLGDPLELLGLAIALNRIPVLSAVSQEIAASLRAFCDRAAQVRLLPNRVRVSRSGAAPSPRRARTRLLLLTRRQKLGHIRRAVELAGLWRRKVGPVELIVRCGPAANDTGRRLADVPRLLGRKWLFSDWNRCLGAALTRLEGLSDEPEAEARRADVVLGMGRALLEGLAAERPCVLIGYEDVIGVVTNDNFEHLSATNFSGRNCRAEPIAQVAKQAAAALQERTALSPANLAKIDIEAGWDDVRAIIDEAIAANLPKPEDRALADALVSAARTSDDAAEFICRALPLLSDAERQTFERLSKATAVQS
jgi:hypothetical protein